MDRIVSTTVRSPYQVLPTECFKCKREICPDEQVTLVPSGNPDPGEWWANCHLICSVCAAEQIVLSEYFDDQRRAADQLHKEKVARAVEARLEQLHADLERIRQQKTVKVAEESGSVLERAYDAMDRAFKLLDTREAELANGKVAIKAKTDRLGPRKNQEREWGPQVMAWIRQINLEYSELVPSRRRLVDAAITAWCAWDALETTTPGDALSRLTISDIPVEALEILAEEAQATKCGWEVRQSGKYGPHTLQQIYKTRIHRKSNKRDIAAEFMETEQYRKLSQRDQAAIFMFAKGDASQVEIAELSGMQPSNVSRLLRKACSRG
jgi:hypothetical protein